MPPAARTPTVDPASATGVTATDERITPALDAFVAGDTARLQTAIDADPEIVNLAWNDNTLPKWATLPHGVDSAISTS